MKTVLNRALFPAACLALAACLGIWSCTDAKAPVEPAPQPAAAPAQPAATKSVVLAEGIPESVAACPGFGPPDAPLTVVAFVDRDANLAEHASLLLGNMAGGYPGAIRVQVCAVPAVQGAATAKVAEPPAAVAAAPAPVEAPAPAPERLSEAEVRRERAVKARERDAARRAAAAMRERASRNKERPAGREAPSGCGQEGCGGDGGCGHEAHGADRAPAAERKKPGKWKPVILRSADIEQLPTEAKGISGCATHGAYGPKVTILAFLDLSSPDRGKVAEALTALETAGGGETATVVCVFQKPGDELSNAAARTMVAAHKLGKLAPFRAALEQTAGEVNAAVFEKAATEAGLDIGEWKKEVASKETWAEVRKQSTLAGWLSVSEGPHLFINGVGVSATAPMPEIRKVFDKQLGYGKRMQNGGAPAEVMHAAMSRSAMEGKYMKYVIWGLTPSDPEPHPVYGLKRPR